MSTSLVDISQAQRDRIAHIDFTLLFSGQVTRIDLTERFNIAPAQATKDLALYRELASTNVNYDNTKRAHIKSDQFKPLFEYDPVRTLATLSQGFGDGFLGRTRSSLVCEAPYHLNQPDLLTVAAITEAIHKQYPLEITYVSLSRGETTRELVPHTLVDNGLRWHVRAFDRDQAGFRDFVLTRIKQIVALTDKTIAEHEIAMQDRQWNRFVELRLVPHPKVQHKETIELDYRMKDGALNVELRAANAGYLLRRWNVDCSGDHSLTGAEYHLALANIEALYGINNLSIAPGYQTSG